MEKYRDPPDTKFSHLFSNPPATPACSLYRYLFLLPGGVRLEELDGGGDVEVEPRDDVDGVGDGAHVGGGERLLDLGIYFSFSAGAARTDGTWLLLFPFLSCLVQPASPPLCVCPPLARPFPSSKRRTVVGAFRSPPCLTQHIVFFCFVFAFFEISVFVSAVVFVVGLVFCLGFSSCRSSFS